MYYEKKMNIKISELFEKINAIYNQNFTINVEKDIYTIDEINTVLDFLQKVKKETNTILYTEEVIKNLNFKN